MRKISFIIAFLMVLSCLSMGISAEETDAQSNSSTLYQTDYFATYYFANLTNYPLNIHGSCSYVAMSMLLSYYDTYWNDNIIPEELNFDQPCILTSTDFSYQSSPSPGVKTEAEDDVMWRGMDEDSYIQTIINYSGSYLFSYLLKIGYDQDYFRLNRDSNKKIGSLRDGGVNDILNRYFVSVEGRDEETRMPSTEIVSADFDSQADIRKFVIQHIRQGIPVILGMSNGRTGQEYKGHSMVAYDYDSSLDTNEEEFNGKIFVHDGLVNTHISIDNLGSNDAPEYTYYHYAIVLKMEGIFHDCIHACSDNYQYTNPITNKTTTYCPCDLPIHPEYEPPILPPPFNPPVPQQPPVHVHDEYWDVCEDWHSYNCETCELSGIEEPHDFVPKQGEYLVDDEHLLVCHCGYTSYGYCSYTAVIRFHDCLTHRKYCACGAYESYNHAFVSAPTSASYNWICIGCGATSNSTTMPTPQSLVSGDVMMQMNSSGVITLPDGTTLQILTETGSYVLSNGIIVLSPEDAALVEAGLLDPYELVENITVPAGPGHVTE